MSQRILCVLGLVTLLLPVQYAGAYEVLTAQELASHCKAVPYGSAQCILCQLCQA